MQFAWTNLIKCDRVYFVIHLYYMYGVRYFSRILIVLYSCIILHMNNASYKDCVYITILTILFTSEKLHSSYKKCGNCIYIYKMHIYIHTHTEVLKNMFLYVCYYMSIYTHSYVHTYTYIHTHASIILLLDDI